MRVYWLWAPLKLLEASGSMGEPLRTGSHSVALFGIGTVGYLGTLEIRIVDSAPSEYSILHSCTGSNPGRWIQDQILDPGYKVQDPGY